MLCFGQKYCQRHHKQCLKVVDKVLTLRRFFTIISYNVHMDRALFSKKN